MKENAFLREKVRAKLSKSSPLVINQCIKSLAPISNYDLNCFCT